MAVPLVGELLQGGVLDVAHAKAEHAQEDAALGLGLDQLDEFILVGDADVEIAVGGQDDAVGAVLDEVLGGDVVSELDAGTAVGRAAGLQLIDGRHDSALLMHEVDGRTSPDAPA